MEWWGFPTQVWHTPQGYQSIHRREAVDRNHGPNFLFPSTPCNVPQSGLLEGDLLGAGRWAAWRVYSADHSCRMVLATRFKVCEQSCKLQWSHKLVYALSHDVLQWLRSWPRNEERLWICLHCFHCILCHSSHSFYSDQHHRAGQTRDSPQILRPPQQETSSCQSLECSQGSQKGHKSIRCKREARYEFDKARANTRSLGRLAFKQVRIKLGAPKKGIGRERTPWQGWIFAEIPCYQKYP